MKAFILSLIFILNISALSIAQEQSLNDFKREFNHRDGIRTFTIPGFLVRIVGKIALKDEDPIDRYALQPLLKNMGSVSILFSEGETSIHPRDIDRLKDDLLDEKYALLVKVHDGQDDIEIFAWEKKDVIRRLVFLVQPDDTDLVLVNVRGYFTADDISKVVERYTKKHGRKL